MPSSEKADMDSCLRRNDEKAVADATTHSKKQESGSPG
jgi:hypothetical protein